MKQRLWIWSAIACAAISSYYGARALLNRAPGSPKRPPSSLAGVGASPVSGAYALGSDEVLRYVANPRPEERAKLLPPALQANPTRVISLTVEWSDRPIAKSMEIGIPVVPRSLRAVLTHSLDLAPRLTGELGVLDRIAVPGDWVVRKGAQLDAVVSELERIVRNLGYSGIRIAPQDAAGPVIIAYDGAPASESVLRIFAAPEGVEPAPVESGTIAQCLDAISAAVGVPIRKQLSDDGEHCVLWENNAPIRVQLGLLPTDDDRQSLLQETSATLGVLFDFDLEVRRQWRVDWEGALPPPLRGKTPPPPK